MMPSQRIEQRAKLHLRSRPQDVPAVQFTSPLIVMPGFGRARIRRGYQ
jgi:hypothetical protein